MTGLSAQLLVRSDVYSLMEEIEVRVTGLSAQLLVRSDVYS